MNWKLSTEILKKSVHLGPLSMLASDGGSAVRCASHVVRIRPGFTVTGERKSITTEPTNRTFLDLLLVAI